MQAEIRDNWMTRNMGWIYPILGGLVMVVSPAAIQTIAFNGESVFPEWLRLLGLVIGILAVALGGFKAYMSDTLTARGFSFIWLIVGSVAGAYQFILWLKR